MSEFSAKYWRNRAAATAAMADRRWIDEKQKFKLLQVALEYDKLADAAASKGQPGQSMTTLRREAAPTNTKMPEKSGPLTSRS